MSKPLKMTEDMIKECVDEFEKSLRSMKLFDGKVKYDTSYEWSTKEKATICFSRVAFEKQNLLIKEFSSEVAWNGLVRRDDDDVNKFYIDDIIIFPQVVTGATVTPDQKEYDKWLMTLPPDQFNHCRYHGHSHVNMGVTPSGVDNTCQKDILGRLDGDGLTEEKKIELEEQLGNSNFYIFMIWNKRGEHTARIYDMYTNTYFDNNEITIVIEGQENFTDFLTEAKEKVKSHSTVIYPSQTSPYYPPAKKDVSTGISGQQKIGFSGDNHRSFPYEYD